MKKSNATKKGVRKKKDKKTLWMSIFILVIMVLSIAGFALMSGGGTKKTSSSNNIPDEYPLQQVEYQGQTFWYAIRNSEQFIFENIDGYDQNLAAKGLADKLKKQEYVEIYIDSNFSSADSLFIVEKALRGIKIAYGETKVEKCESNTLVFTNNENLTGNCMKFISYNEEAFSKANILVYHLVKE